MVSRSIAHWRKDSGRLYDNSYCRLGAHLSFPWLEEFGGRLHSLACDEGLVFRRTLSFNVEAVASIYRLRWEIEIKGVGAKLGDGTDPAGSAVLGGPGRRQMVRYERMEMVQRVGVYPCHNHSSAPGSVWRVTLRSTCPAFFAKT